MAILTNALMCYQKVKLINHDCLPILMLLYLMLYTMLAALSNAYFLPLISANAFVFMLCLGLLTHSLFDSSII